MAPGVPSDWRKALENRLAGLIPEFESLLEAEAAARAEAVRQSVSERLNQAVRRLREAADFSAAAAVLVDSCGGFCNGAAVFRVTGDNTLKGESVRGVEDRLMAGFTALEISAPAGAAFAAAVGGDPQVTLSSPRELSPAVAAYFAHGPEERVALFPIGAGGKTAGVLYAWGETRLAALELLAQAAGMALAARRPAEAVPAGLVAIAPAEPAARPAPDWDALPAAEREIHLRARRFARVQVAEMRLYRPQAVAAGLARRDLYGALGEQINAARETFRRQFLIPTPGMVDYVHEELLRTLAGNDPALLGGTYPGPLA